MIEDAIKLHGQRLYGLCMTLCRSRSDADDLYQETWIKVMMNIDKYQTNMPFEPWLTRICVNVYKDRRRAMLAKRIFDRFTTNEEKDAFLESVQPTRDVDFQYIHDAVNRLPEKYRVVIILYYFKELDVQSTADTLSIHVGTVKSRLHKARSLLKEVLNDEVEL